MITLKPDNMEEENVYIVSTSFDKMKELTVLNYKEIPIYKVIGFCKINGVFCFKVIDMFYNAEMHISFYSVKNANYKLISESEFLAGKLAGEY